MNFFQFQFAMFDISAPILQVTDCVRNTTAVQDDVNSCTFQSISDAMWINDSHILIFERLDGSFRYGKKPFVKII